MVKLTFSLGETDNRNKESMFYSRSGVKMLWTDGKCSRIKGWRFQFKQGGLLRRRDLSADLRKERE